MSGNGHHHSTWVNAKHEVKGVKDAPVRYSLVVVSTKAVISLSAFVTRLRSEPLGSTKKIVNHQHRRN